jgi:hypothetical protein
MLQFVRPTRYHLIDSKERLLTPHGERPTACGAHRQRSAGEASPPSATGSTHPSRAIREIAGALPDALYMRFSGVAA